MNESDLKPPRSVAATLRLGLPKGRMQDAVFALMADAGMPVRMTSRSYRPALALPDVSVKLLKPQNIIEMLHHGSRDLGFAGADWVAELGREELVELLDTSLDPVRLVAAAPVELLEQGKLPRRHIVVASEYTSLARNWAQQRGIAAEVHRTWGATEVFPPEDADVIIDNTATGSTLRANGLEIVDELMRSSTRLYANARALDEPGKRERIECFAVMLRSVLDARRRVMIEVNVGPTQLDALVELLPCMRRPTVSVLSGDGGFAVKAAIPRDRLVELIPRIRACGGSDIVISNPSQILP